jgi:KEOPS complex subunit Cgi121
METSGETYEIRQAEIIIDDRDAFLCTLQEIARSNSTHIVCFDADKLAGRDHAKIALHHAVRSFFSGKPISNSFEMEALLFAAGSRQCLVAALFGIKKGINRIFACVYPGNQDVWKDLSTHMHFVAKTWDEMTPEKETRLMVLFGITQEELDAVGRERMKDLLFERIALLHVNR